MSKREEKGWIIPMEGAYKKTEEETDLEERKGATRGVRECKDIA